MMENSWRAADDAAAPWEVRARKPSGTWSKWEKGKAAKGEPADPEDEVVADEVEGDRLAEREELRAIPSEQRLAHRGAVHLLHASRLALDDKIDLERRGAQKARGRVHSTES